MGNKILFICVLLTILLVLTTSVKAHGGSADKPVHQYVTNESGEIWKLMPPEIKSHLNNDIYNQLDEVGEADYDSGDDVVTGSGEEDFSKTSHDQVWRNHYWDPDDPDFSQYDTGLILSKGSFIHSTFLWDEAINLYLKGSINESYYYLGRVSHLLQDATVPAHMHNDCHITESLWYGIPSYLLCKPLQEDEDEYEYFIADVNNTFPNTQNKPNFYHWKGENYQNQYYRYENLTYLTDAQWLEVNKRLDEVSYPSNLFKLFWYTAQKTQYFASDDNNGNDYYREWYQIIDTNTFSPSLWAGENVNITSDKTKIEDASTCNSIGKCPNLRNISEALMPHAMKATAGLYRLFMEVGL